MKKFKIGLQLYSLRGDMEKDMDATLRKVSEMGYECVEFAGYFGKSAEEVKAMLDKYNLEAVSVHQGYEVFLEDEKSNIDYLKTLGVKYCAVPWMDKAKLAGNDVYPNTVKDMTQVAEALKKNGIQMCYHNHDFEFEKFEDKFLLDWLYESIPADLLQPEIDTCWVKYSGNDPVEYINKYAGRMGILHLKDFVSDKFAQGPVYALIDENGNSGESEKNTSFEFRPVGSGIQDFEAILKAAENAGIEYLIVEQDDCPTASPIDSVKQSREYLKTLGQ